MSHPGMNSHMPNQFVGSRKAFSTYRAQAWLFAGMRTTMALEVGGAWKTYKDYSFNKLSCFASCCSHLSHTNHLLDEKIVVKNIFFQILSTNHLHL